MASVSVELRSSAIKSQLLRVVVIVVKVVLLFMDGTVVPEPPHRLDHIIQGRSFPTTSTRVHVVWLAQLTTVLNIYLWPDTLYPHPSHMQKTRSIRGASRGAL